MHKVSQSFVRWHQRRQSMLKQIYARPICVSEWTYFCHVSSSTVMLRLSWLMWGSCVLCYLFSVSVLSLYVSLMWEESLMWLVKPMSRAWFKQTNVHRSQTHRIVTFLRETTLHIKLWLIWPLWLNLCTFFRFRKINIVFHFKFITLPNYLAFNEFSNIEFFRRSKMFKKNLEIHISFE